jgi:tRNA G18 (ribose-2'-O)-methylase SpoU
MDFEQNHSNGAVELAANTFPHAAQLSDASEIFRERQAARGYFGIGIENTKTEINIGTLWRSANLFGAAFIFTIGKRYSKQHSDTMRSERHIPLYDYSDFAEFYSHLPHSCQLVGVELVANSLCLPDFEHPERAVYLLGAEDHGLSKVALERCHHIVEIPTAKPFSLNVAVSGSLVMYDRYSRNSK